MNIFEVAEYFRRNPTPRLRAKETLRQYIPGTSESATVYREEVLWTRKARLFSRGGLWYATNGSADYPGVGGTPEIAFQHMLRNCQPEVRKDFLRVTPI